MTYLDNWYFFHISAEICIIIAIPVHMSLPEPVIL